MTMRENAAKVAEGLRKAIWERIEKRIDEQPIDGISAGNEFSEVIRAEQRGIVVGLRGARLSAISTVANFDFFPNPTRAKLEECVRAMEAADDKDWDHLDAFLGQSGHGQFWRKTLWTLRERIERATALQETEKE